MKYCKCKYCGEEFESSKLGGHTGFCVYNPNREKNIIRLGEARKNIKIKEDICYCEYCGKQFKNKGNLGYHKRKCKENPENTKFDKNNIDLKQEREQKKRLPMSEEGRKNISIARKKYLETHKDEHPWKRNTKFISVPCENLKNKLTDLNISYVEEYSPFEDYNYSIDIAFPNIKVGIEVNGNQHYNSDGTLKEYYKNRHDIFVSRGWTIYEVHYSKCYNINLKDFQDILNLDVYDKSYVEEFFVNAKNLKLKRDKEIENTRIENKKRVLEKRNKRYEYYKECFYDLKNNSGIDFSIYGWTIKAQKYIFEKFNISIAGNLTRMIKRYYPEFFDNSVYVRSH